MALAHLQICIVNHNLGKLSQAKLVWGSLFMSQEGLLPSKARPHPPSPRVPHLQPQSRETTWALRQAVNNPGMACPLWVLLTQQKMKLAFLWVLTRWVWGLSSSPTLGHLCSRLGSTVKSLRQGGTVGSPQIYSRTSPLTSLPSKLDLPLVYF